MKELIISLGNPLKSDDNIGNLVLDELKKTVKDKNVYFIRGESSPENFIGQIKKINPSQIYFLDAIIFDGKAGDVNTFSLDQISDMSISTTHRMSMKMFKKLFPDAEIILIGVKPENLEYGEELSLSLRENFDNILDRITKII